MSDKPPFDLSRALLLLIGGVFAVACLVIVGVMATCFIYYDAVIEGRYKCDADNRVFDLLATLISSALALYAGRKT